MRTNYNVTAYTHIRAIIPTRTSNLAIVYYATQDRFYYPYVVVPNVTYLDSKELWRYNQFKGFHTYREAKTYVRKYIKKNFLEVDTMIISSNRLPETRHYSLVSNADCAFVDPYMLKSNLYDWIINHVKFPTTKEIFDAISDCVKANRREILIPSYMTTNGCKYILQVTSDDVIFINEEY